MRLVIFLKYMSLFFIVFTLANELQLIADGDLPWWAHAANLFVASMHIANYFYTSIWLLKPINQPGHWDKYHEFRFFNLRNIHHA